MLFAFNYVMKKSFSILLSFILLAGHMYLTIGTHYCGGEAVESRILFGETHPGCKMSDTHEPCRDSEKTNNKLVRIDKVPCCENEYQTVQITNEYIKDATQETVNVAFALAYIFISPNLDLYKKSTHQGYSEYISPPLEKDIQVLFQIFLS